MRILSNFHDYYDSVQYSRTPIWKRNTWDLEFGEPLYGYMEKPVADFLKNIIDTMPTQVYKHAASRFFLLCCGKVYPVYEIYEHVWPADKITSKVFTYLASTPEEYIDKYNEIMKDSIEPEKRAFWPKQFPFNDQGHGEWLRNFAHPWISRIHIEFLKSPIILVKHNEIIVNPRLNHLGFQKIVDPWTMYQQIETYLSNDMVMIDAPKEFDDVTKRDMHGFNDWSFKQEGPKRRKRKK